MNHLNIFLCLLYIVFSIIIDFILVYLYIKNVKIQKFLISNYFKYMILSSTLSILDGLTIIINKIQNYELYILIKFNMVYTINLSLMLILFILSDYSIINSIFIIKYWNVITNIIIGFIWLIPVFKLKHEKNNINNNIVDNVFDIRYLNNNITDEEKLYYEIYENKFKE